MARTELMRRLLTLLITSLLMTSSSSAAPAREECIQTADDGGTAAPDPCTSGGYCPESCQWLKTMCAIEGGGGILDVYLQYKDPLGSGALACLTEAGIGLGADAIFDIEDLAGLTASAMCNLIDCFVGKGAMPNPHIRAIQLTCACGNLLASAIRCATQAALCKSEIEAAKPIVLTECPLGFVSAMACPNGAPATDWEIETACYRAYRHPGTNSAGLTAQDSVRCFSECVRNTRDVRDVNCSPNTPSS